MCSIYALISDEKHGISGAIKIGDLQIMKPARQRYVSILLDKRVYTVVIDNVYAIDVQI